MTRSSLGACPHTCTLSRASFQPEFDASQYGFFGEMLLPNEELGGALEVRRTRSG